MASSFTVFGTLILLSHILISHTSNVTCDYGYFTTSNNPNSSYNGQCVFMCATYSTQKQTEILYSNISFKIIKDSCWQVENANCTSLNDLVWNDNCDCPRCKCNQPHGFTQLTNKRTYFEKECHECQCNIQNTQNETGWECNQQYRVDTIEDWNQYACNITAITCTDPLTASTYVPGNGYWQQNTIDPTCQTYCYCNFDGTIDCESSYANILTSSNPSLTYQFKDNCEWSIAGCMHDISLFYNSSNYCQCPNCRCPTGKNLGDKWHIEYTRPMSSRFDDDPNDRTSCRECTCVDQGSGLQQYCEYQNNYDNGTETCPMTYHNCTEGWRHNNTRPTQIEQCYGEERQYCSWQYEPDRNQYDWGCDGAMGCEAFTLIENSSVTSDCVHINVNITGTTDCGKFVFGVNQYHYCCKGDYCNDMDINITQCREDPWLNEWYSEFMGCKYGALHRQYFCSNVDEYTCNDIQIIGTSYFGCECTAYSTIYHKVGNWGKHWLTVDMERRFVNLHNWAQFFGCNLTWTCNLTATGLISLNGIIQSPQPTAFPTITPTGNTISPTITPTIITINPTITPSNNPTNKPSYNPTPNPSKIPTKFASDSPTPGPTNNPTKIPTKFPFDSPTIDPTEKPTREPTQIPSNSPIPGPTNNPSMTPSSNPTIVSINPSLDPTYILTDIPTKNPTELTEIPTKEPSENPTYDPSLSPTISPSNAPSLIPTNAPTNSPTYCRNAKYRHKMYGISEDCLWGNDLLISPNCKYSLQMRKNGNLILYGYIGNINLELWMTDTMIFNHSGESVSKFIVTNNAMSVIEYTYKNVDRWGQYVLWNIDINGDNVVLELNDFGCLILININIEFDETNIIWEQCPPTTQPTAVVITDIYTTDSFDSDEDSANVRGSSRKKKAEDLWWVWLLVIVVILGLFIAFFILKPYCHNGSNQTWVTAPKTTELEHEYEDEDNDEHETDQINKWMKETEMGNMETNVGETEGGNGMLLGNVEIMSNYVVQTNDDYINDAEMVFNS